MKVITPLPDKRYYSFKKQTDKGFLFEDKQSRSFQILSPVPHPFDMEWCVLIGNRWAKFEGEKYAAGIIFRLFEISPKNQDISKGELMRETYQGFFAYSSCPNIGFWSAPINEKSTLWLAYYIP